MLHTVSFTFSMGCEKFTFSFRMSCKRFVSSFNVELSRVSLKLQNSLLSDRIRAVPLFPICLTLFQISILAVTMVKSMINLASASQATPRSGVPPTPLSSPTKGSSSSIAALASASTRTVICVNCEEEEAVVDCCAWSGNKMSCKRCKTNYNRQNERGRKETVWRNWWKNLTPEEKVSWYKKQKSLNPQKWQRKSYDDSVLETEDYETKSHNEASIDDFVPRSEFIKEQRMIGATEQEAEEAWLDALADPQVLKRDHTKHGRLVHIFRGLRDTDAEETGYKSGLKRRKLIHDAGDAAEAAEMAREHDEMAGRWLAQNREASNADAFVARADVEGDEMYNNPAEVSVPAASLLASVERDAVLQTKAEAQYEEALEADMHMAREAAKLQNPNTNKGGRPRRPRSVILADCAAMMQQKLSAIAASKVSVETSVREVVSEYSRDCEANDQLKSVKKALQDEAADVIQDLDKIAAKVNALKVEDAIDAEGSGDVEFKASLAQTLAEVPKKQAAIALAVRTFRNAVKKISKKSKGKSEPIIEIDHPSCKMILEFVETLDDDKSIGLAMTRLEAFNGNGPFQFVLGVNELKALTKVVGVSTHQEWLTKQLTKPDGQGEARTSAMSHFRSKTRDQLQTDVAKHLRDFFLPIHAPSDKKELVKEIFDVQAYSQLSNHCYTGLLPYGVAECRLLTEGACILMGIPLEYVEGEDLQKKENFIWKPQGAASMRARLQQNKDKIWLHRHEEIGSVVYIPAGHFVCVVGLHDVDCTVCTGLRWSVCDFSSQTELAKVKESVDMVISAYPSLGDLGYTQWKDLLTKYFIPLAVAQSS